MKATTMEEMEKILLEEPDNGNVEASNIIIIQDANDLTDYNYETGESILKDAPASGIRNRNT